MMRSSFLILAFPLLLSACATVPLPGREQPALRPVKPLMEGRGNVVVAKDSKKPSEVKLTTPQQSGKPTTSAQKTSLSAAEIKTQLQEAEDKIASARSLAQSAQTAEDWQLVAQQSDKAIVLLKTLTTSNKVLSAQIQQARSNAQRSFDRANAAQNAPKSSGNAPIKFDRSKSGNSEGLIYGDIPAPSPTSSPTSNPSASPVPSPKN